MLQGKLIFALIIFFLSYPLLRVLSLPSGCHWKTHVYLDCSNAGLERFPSDISNSTMYIDLSRNSLLKFKEDFFLRFHDLQMLSLEGCWLKGPVILPKSLKRFIIRDNSFNEATIRKTFENVSSSLYYIDITHNELTLERVLRFLPKTVTRLRAADNIMPVVRKDYFREFRKLIYLNLDSCGIKRIEENSFDKLVHLHIFSLSYNKLESIPDNLFQSSRNLGVLYLDNNKFSRPPVFQGLARLETLNLHHNRIERLLPTDFYKKQIGRLVLNDNQIRTFDLRNTKYLKIDLSYNRIERLDAFAFRGRRALTDIMLQNNDITHISPLAFKGMIQIVSLYLQRNNISSLPKGIFKNIIVNNLFLYGNNISSMDGVLDNMRSPPMLLLLFSNPPLKSIKVWDYRTMSNHSSIYVSCDSFKQIAGSGDLRANINCFPSVYFSIRVLDSSLERDGFKCTLSYKTRMYSCTPCPLGFYTDLLSCHDGCCKQCPAGSFYQDDLAMTYCKPCPAGQYVPPSRSPGKSPLECLTCPDGTKKNHPAGYRACKCLDGFARTDRFGKCNKCSQRGIECRRDYPELLKDYWWIWHDGSPSNSTCKKSFVAFMKNLDIKNNEYDRATSSFSCALPQPHHCPVKGSCLGGVDATCLSNYTGILCSVCEKGYSRQFQKCLKCPKPVYAILQFIGYITLFVFICLLVSWTDKIKVKIDEDYTRTFADIVLSNLKILLGFYQVLIVIIHAFSNVNWPHSLKKTIGIFQFVQLEVFRIPSLRCLKPEWGLNSIHEFWIALIGTTAFPIVILAYLAVKVAYLYFAETLHANFIRRSRVCKRNCFRVLVLFFFVTYPLTAQRIVQVLPISCHNICTSMKNGKCLHQLSYLKSDYSVKCLSLSGSSRLTLVLAYVAIIIPVGLPLLLFCLLLKYIPDCKKQEDAVNIQEENEFLITVESNRSEESGLQFALKFLYENYDSGNRYWEPLEMIRKLIMTAGVTLFIGYYKTGIGTTIVVAGFFAILHAFRRPMRDSFENILQLLSLSIMPINLCLGVILKSNNIANDDARLRPNDDNAAIGYLLVILNLFVLLLVIIRLVYSVGKASSNLCTAVHKCFHRVCCCFFKTRRAENQRVLLLE